MYTDIFLLVSTVSFFIWTLRSLYKDIVFFQKLPHSFLYPKQNKFTFIASSLFSFTGVLSWLVLIVSFFMTITDLSALFVQALIAALFLGKALLVLSEIRDKKLFNTHIYPRSVILLVVSFFCIVLLSFFPLTIHSIWILLLERATFFIALTLLFIFGFPTELLDDVSMKKALIKMRGLKSSTKILILGGDGNEMAWMLKEVIKSSKSVYSLPANILTRGELSREILKIKQSRDVFILSINAENTYLFKFALRIFQPDICIISSSSLSQGAKVLNIRSFSEEVDRKTKIILPVEYESPARHFMRKNILIYYSTQKNVTTQNNVFIEDIIYKRSGIHFSLVFNSQTVRLESNSIDTDVINMLVPVAVAAKILYVQMRHLQLFASKALYPASMFRLEKTKTKQTIINGLNVSSVEKIIRETEYLEVFGKLIVIIGRISPTITKKDLLLLGASLNKVSGSVILLHHEYLRPLRAGMKDTKGNSKIVCLSVTEAQKMLKSSDNNERILFLGESSEPLYHSIAHKE